MQDPSPFTQLITPSGMTLPFPEQEQLKCPRCDSPNTKFCYYNNYNLSQPRHFCKSCRRYWTKGGALRNIPVGGGTRKPAAKRSSSKRPPQKPDPIPKTDPIVPSFLGGYGGLSSGSGRVVDPGSGSENGWPVYAASDSSTGSRFHSSVN